MNKKVQPTRSTVFIQPNLLDTLVPELALGVAAGARVRVLALETSFPDGEKFLDWLERRLRAHAGGREATVAARRPS